MTWEKRTPPVRAGGASENTRKAIREPLKDSPLSQQIQPPPDFKPERFPILSTHFFGVDAPSVRRGRLVEHLHALGARSLLELLTELVGAHGIGADLDARLERYARLDPEVVEALGGRDIPKPPVHEVAA